MFGNNTIVNHTVSLYNAMNFNTLIHSEVCNPSVLW